MMEFESSDLPGVQLIRPKIFSDARGYFLESFSHRDFSAHGITGTFVQDNRSFSRNSGVIRGLHFQYPPMQQAKVIRVEKGAIRDVVVDLRKGSPTFGAWRAFDLSAGSYEMLFVPAGFAHGFCTLEPATEIFYKVDNYYSPPHDGGIRWDDPTLGIAWPSADPELSPRDRGLPLLSAIESPFTYT